MNVEFRELNNEYYEKKNLTIKVELREMNVEFRELNNEYYEKKNLTIIPLSFV